MRETVVGLFLVGLFLWTPLRAQPITFGMYGQSSYITHPTLSEHFETGRSLGATFAYAFDPRVSVLAQIAYTSHARNLMKIRANPYVDPRVEVSGGSMSLVSISVGSRGRTTVWGPVNVFGTVTAGMYRGTWNPANYTGPGSQKIDGAGSRWWDPGIGVSAGLEMDLFDRGRIFTAPTFTKLLSGRNATIVEGYHALSIRAGLGVQL